MSDKLRWRIARILDHLPWTCWANLVSWAQRSDGYGLRETRQDSLCRSDLARNGCCYCNKIRSVPPVGVSSSRETETAVAEKDWRIKRLPDGRLVEFVDAALVDHHDDEYVCDVTVLINGQNLGTHRVTVTNFPG